MLTAAGEAYSARHLASLNAVEDRAAERFGPERIRDMVELVLEYDRALGAALEEIAP